VPVNIIIGGGEKLPAFDSLHYLDWQAFTDIWVNMPFIFRIIISNQIRVPLTHHVMNDIQIGYYLELSVVFVDLYSV